MTGKVARLWVLVCLAVAGSGSGACASGAAEPVPAPEALGFARPSPEPTLPAGFETFTLPAFASVADQRLPTIAESSRQAGPGDAIALAGAHLDDSAARYVVFGDVAGGGAKLLRASAIAANSLGAAVTLPPELARDGMVLLWAGTADRRTMPVAINRTDAWWVGPSAVRAGGPTSVYGRNLMVGAPAKIYLKPPGAAGRWIDAIAATSNPYKLDFVVPRDLGVGVYELWVHNRRGGHYGWSGPLKLSVIADPDAWTGPTIDVRRFGAVGDGRHDDGDALAKAAKAAEGTPRSTILLARGTYLVSMPLSLPSSVRWQGAGKDLTTIRAAAGFTGEALLAMSPSSARGSNSAFSGFTLDGESQAGDGKLPALLVLHGQSQVRFSGVRFRSAGQASIGSIHDASRVSFDGCDFIGGVLFAGNSPQFFVTRSTFQQGPGVAASIHVVGGREVAVSQSSFRNRYPVHTGQGRAFVIQGWGGAVSNVYFGDNRSDGLATGPLSKDQNTGEQVMFEMAGVTFAADVVSATPSAAIVGRIVQNKLTVASASRSDVAIVSGTGTGQVRRIAAFDAATNRLSVDRPWRVAPDATSRLAAGGFLSHAVVYRNVLTGMDDWNARVSASAGVELYGNTYDNIADANVVTSVVNGIYVAALNAEEKFGLPFQVSYFNLLRNNRIANAVRGIATSTTFYKNASPGDVGMFGNVYRGNQTRDTLQSAIVAQGCNRIEGGVQLFNIFAGNQLRGAGAHFRLDNSVSYLKDNIKPPAAVGPGSLMLANMVEGIAPGLLGVRADLACPYYAAGNSWQRP